MNLDRALALIQEALSISVDEAVITAVFYVMLTEGALGDFQKVHNHLKGIAIMYTRFLEANVRVSPLLKYIAAVCGYLDTVPGLTGWPLAIPEDILPPDILWLKDLKITAESNQWIQHDFKHVDFQRQIARYKFWATSQRKLERHSEKDEIKIVEHGHRIIRLLQEWQALNIPPYTEETLSFESSPLNDTTDPPRFLRYPRCRFDSPLHAEIHLQFYGLILITSFIISPCPGSVSEDRIDTAIKYCQCLAAMGSNPGAMALGTRTFGQFYARLTFDDIYPEGNSKILALLTTREELGGRTLQRASSFTYHYIASSLLYNSKAS
jgi:hypothetical protein